MEVLREIQDKTFDLCLTDPPYGIGVTKMTLGNGKNKIYRGNTEWDVLPTEQIFNQMRRISKHSIFWGGNYFANMLPASRCWLVWDKGTGENSFADCELCWTNFDSVVKKRFISWVGANAKDTPVRYHPTQKPVALFVWCLLNYSKPGDLVIDPFCGSGTTALACHKTGRKFLCIDKDEEYIKIAQQRYADLIAQQNLFEENQDGALETAEGRGAACNSGRDAMPLTLWNDDN